MIGFFLVILAIVGVVYAIASLLAWDGPNADGILFGVILAVAGGAGTYHYTHTPAYLAQEARERAEAQAQEARESTPHVIREADGCKVYEFKSGGRFHFFTRCPSYTTTQRNYEECHQSGKTKHCEVKSEVVNTTNTLR